MIGKRIQDQGRTKRTAPALVVGLAAVLVTGGALALQDTPPAPDEVAAAEPSSVPLTKADLACPAGVSGGSPLVLARVPGSGGGAGSEGKVVTRPVGGKQTTPVKLRPDRAVTSDVEGPVIVAGSGSAAPGLFGGRFGDTEAPSGVACATPAGERWFVGAGAGGLHESSLRLVNPDGGPAVADLTIWSTTGELQQVESRGLTIPPGKASEIDLAELVPQREELAVQLTVARGRVAASMQDTYEPEGAEASSDWLPGTAEPATSQVIPGLPRTADESTLVLVNPGDDAGRVSLEVRGAESEFAPSGVEEIQVPAGRVVVTELTEQLKQAVAQEDASLSLSSTVPVAATLRTVTNQDLAHLPAVAPVEGASSTPVGPTGEQKLVLSATSQAGTARARFLAEGAKGEVASEQVRIRPGTTSTLEVPDGTRAVVVESSVSHLGTVRSVVEGGIVAMPLRELLTERLIPDVRSSWP